MGKSNRGKGAGKGKKGKKGKGKKSKRKAPLSDEQKATRRQEKAARKRQREQDAKRTRSLMSILGNPTIIAPKAKVKAEDKAAQEETQPQVQIIEEAPKPSSPTRTLTKQEIERAIHEINCKVEGKNPMEEKPELYETELKQFKAEAVAEMKRKIYKKTVAEHCKRESEWLTNNAPPEKRLTPEAIYNYVMVNDMVPSHWVEHLDYRPTFGQQSSAHQHHECTSGCTHNHNHEEKDGYIGPASETPVEVPTIPPPTVEDNTQEAVQGVSWEELQEGTESRNKALWDHYSSEAATNECATPAQVADKPKDDIALAEGMRPYTQSC